MIPDSKVCLVCSTTFYKRPTEPRKVWEIRECCSIKCGRINFVNKYGGAKKKRRDKVTLLRERVEKALKHNYCETTVTMGGRIVSVGGKLESVGGRVVILEGKIKDKKWWREKVEKTMGQVKARMALH